MKKIYLLIGCIFFICLFTEAQVRVNGPVNPSSPLDLYPTHIDSLGHGGFMAVTSKAIRNSIPPLRRKQGMLVYVRETDSVYQLKPGSINNALTDTDWDKFKLGAVGGLTWWGELEEEPAGTPQLNWAYYNSNDKITYIYSIDGPMGVPAWTALVTPYELPTVIDDDRTFTGETIRFTGGQPVGPENIVLKSSIQLDINRQEGRHTINYGYYPKFRRFVLGLSDDGKIELVSPNIIMTMVAGEKDIRSGTTVNANSYIDIDIELTSLLPQLHAQGNGEQVPSWYYRQETIGGPTIAVRQNGANQPSYDPDDPASYTLLGVPPQGLIIAWSAIINGPLAEVDTNIFRPRIFVRMRLQNITNSAIILPDGIKFRATVWGIDDGLSNIYGNGDGEG